MTALSNRQIARAALVVLLGFLASGILGLIRSIAFSAIFGASAELDVFFAAQRLPETLYTLVAGGALGSSFLPVFSRYLSLDDHDSAWRLASAVMTLSGLVATALGVLLIVLSPFIVPIFVRQVPPGYEMLAVRMTQLMLVTTVIFTVSGLVMSILNAHGNFILPSLALSMYNIGYIIGALAFAPIMSITVGLFAYPPEQLITRMLPTGGDLFVFVNPSTANIYGLALGAILGAALHLGVQVQGLVRIQARLRVLPNLRVPGVVEVLRLMVPRVLGLGVAQINFLINVYFATGMTEGSNTALNYGWFLMFFTLGIVAQSAGTAVFPSLSALAAANDLVGFKDRLSAAMRSVLFLALPASVGLIVLGEPIIAVLYERGAWTAEATAATAWALGFFALGIAGHSLLELLSRAFYALSDTWTPVLIGVASLVSNIILSLIFIQFIGDPFSLERGAFGGLALANSVTTLLESAALWWLLNRHINGVNDRFVLTGAVRALVAALVMGVAVIAVRVVVGETGALFTTIAGMGVGVVVFFGAALILGIDEARTIPNVVLSRLRR